jgi:hypothetical protein
MRPSRKPSTALKHLGQPDDIPGMIAFLSSDDANFNHRSGDQRVQRLDHERLDEIVAIFDYSHLCEMRRRM